MLNLFIGSLNTATLRKSLIEFATRNQSMERAVVNLILTDFKKEGTSQVVCR